MRREGGREEGGGGRRGRGKEGGREGTRAKPGNQLVFNTLEGYWTIMYLFRNQRNCSLELYSFSNP